MIMKCDFCGDNFEYPSYGDQINLIDINKIGSPEQHKHFKLFWRCDKCKLDGVNSKGNMVKLDEYLNIRWHRQNR